MVESENTSPRLAELRRRWEENRESRVFLQLAEEYRRLDRFADAAQVIEEGLAHRPGDIAAMVALGRCRLDSGEVAVARDVLEQVIARDPAHIVASKLLVDAHLRAGNAAEARERLSFYRLINDRDPELDHFAYRLEMLEQETAPPAVRSAEPFDLGPPVPDHGSGIFELPPPRPAIAPRAVSRPAPREGGPVPRARAVTHDQPFGVLAPLPIPDSSIWFDGPFARIVADGGAPDRTPVAPAGDQPAVTAARDDVAEAVAEPEADIAELEDFGAEDQVVFGLVDAPADPPLAEPQAAEPQTAESVAEAGGDTPSTLAMAEIYAEQGHTDEAVRVLERIIESAPANLVARRRLAALLGASAVPAFEAEPLEDDPAAAAEPFDDEAAAAAELFEDEVAAAKLFEEEATPAARDDVPRDDVPRDDVPRDDVPRDDVPRDDVPRDDVLSAAQLLGPSPPAGLTARKRLVLGRYLATLRRGRAQTEMRDVS